MAIIATLMRYPRPNRRLACIPLCSAILVLLGSLSIVSREAAAQHKKPPMSQPPSLSVQVCAVGDPCSEAGATVSPKGGSVFQTSGAKNYVFTVTNTGLASGTLYFSATCGGITSGCSVAGSSPFTSGQAKPITVNYTVSATPGSGTVTLHAENLSGTSTDDGWITVTNVPPATYTVSVTPDGTNVTGNANSNRTQTFTVTNSGNTTGTYTLAATCSGALIRCDVTPGAVTVTAGGSTAPVVAYSTRAAGTTGRATLKATLTTNSTIADTGWIAVSVVAGTGSPSVPIVDVASVNPGTTVERSLCLTVALGRNGAAECGDLRLVHPLPSTRVLNKARTPALLYNSQTASPLPLVAANVTLSGTASIPDSITARLVVGGATAGRGTWLGADWGSAAATRRITVPCDSGCITTTGITDYSLAVTSWYAAGPQSAASVPGQLTTVDRRSSPFGAGWWLAGLERLIVASKTWIGGDGSVHIYQPTANSKVWAGPALDRPDTLKFVWDAITNDSVYQRDVEHGVRVLFNRTGQHIATVNRLSHRTAFTYNTSGGAANGNLVRITLPGITGAYYDFVSNPTTGKLDSVVAPSAGTARRVTRFTMSAGQLLTITEPDTARKRQFMHVAGTNRVSSETSPRGTVTSYYYDAAWRVSKGSTPPGGSSAAIEQTVRAAETRGIPNGLLVGAVIADSGYALIDGPRADLTDLTKLWLDRFGQPVVIVNATGDTTRIVRSDVRWPALATLVKYPNGQKVSASYDGRGNVSTRTDSSRNVGGQYATTRYAFDSKWDFVTKVVPPTLDSVVMSYDALSGNRDWQQTRTASGASATTSYFYYTSGTATGLMRAIAAPGGERDSTIYDAVAANYAGTRTPKGIWSYVWSDAIGRDTLAATAIDVPMTLWQYDTTRFNVSSEVVKTVRSAPAYNGLPAQSLTIKNYYNRDGKPDSLQRFATPDNNAIGTITTRWRYDMANRTVTEIAPDGMSDSSVYDLASNIVEYYSRVGILTRTTYDVLNRVVTRVTPEVVYSDTTFAGWTFPRYPTCQSVRMCVPADTATYSYDKAGNTVRADNRDARVNRTYNTDGTIATDTLRIRTYAELASGGSFNLHVYGLRYGYDIGGRRIWTKLPRQLGASLSASPGVIFDSLALAYGSDGALSRVRSVLGNDYGFRYNANGGIDSIVYPLGHFRRNHYDQDTRLDTIAQNRLSTSAYSNLIALTYDARGKAVTSRPLGSDSFAPDLENVFTGLGMVRSSTRSVPIASRWDAESWDIDAFANIREHDRSFGVLDGTSSTTGGYWGTNSYQPSTGRLISISEIDAAGVNDVHCADIRTTTATSQRYDRSGNLYWSGKTGIESHAVVSTWAECDWNPINFNVGKRNYYGADGKLRITDVRSSLQTQGRTAYEEFRYDALGRRVLRRSRDDVQCGQYCRELIQRFVWDGSQIAAEMQYPGGNGVSSADLERDTTTLQSNGRRFGRVLYTYGLELDQPIEVAKIGHGIQCCSVNYGDGPTYLTWEALGIAPDWDWQGRGYGNAFYGPTAPCKGSGADPKQCVTIAWPVTLTYWGQAVPEVPGDWYGSLLEDQRDLAGQLYKRNRYYDAATGRFTQEDPIGLAGGINLYGYAGGDPISYSDPFGLCTPMPGCLTGWGSLLHWLGIGSSPYIYQQPDNVVWDVGIGLTLGLRETNFRSDGTQDATDSFDIPGVGISAKVRARDTTVHETEDDAAVNAAKGPIGLSVSKGSVEASAGLRTPGLPGSVSFPVPQPPPRQYQEAPPVKPDATTVSPRPY